MKMYKKLIVGFIVSMGILLLGCASNASVTENEKEKIKDFINEENYSNLLVYENYNSAKEIKFTEFGITTVIANKCGKPVEEQVEGSEIYNITHNLKAYYFTLEDANNFTEKILGIKFSEFEDYEEYKNSHTTSDNKTTFYQVTEGGSDYWQMVEEKNIKDVITVANGDYKVEIEVKDQYNNIKAKNNIVTLRKSGDNFIFVSCNEISNKEKISNFINDMDNLIFSYYNYSEPRKMPVEDQKSSVYGLAGKIASIFGTAVPEQVEGSEIYKLTSNMKAKSFSKAKADEFTQLKLGINFDSLEGYKAYQKTHTTTADNETFYQVLEGGGVFVFDNYEIKDIKELNNGQFEVTVYNTREGESGGQEGFTNIVTLKPNGYSYLFVSCVSYNDEDKENNNNNTINDSNNIVDDKNSGKDNTQANTPIPQTGDKILKISMAGLVFSVLAISVILIYYKKYKF